LLAVLSDMYNSYLKVGDDNKFTTYGDVVQISRHDISIMRDRVSLDIYINKETKAITSMVIR
jgi:hypothetical protein